ncbi:importin subunit alpha-5 isoform X1 [Bombyx mori]|uniref:Importin subunit alpha n=1 Tax=Bombyx mori TaxID=7091 RepID=A0A8R1WMV6_BOMMO|nr:importin subunit alpha-5 isoform X1 [Bombyx mori]
MAERTSRLSSYKNAGQGTTELRRKRAELSVALRKQARDEQLLKRRAMSPETETPVETEKVMTPEEILEELKSQDLTRKTNAARAARRMLSREQKPPISIMVNAGVIKPLVEALDHDECSDLQFEAAWALTNIASGTRQHTMAVVDGGAVPKLISLLGQGGVVGEQCAWALGNIAGDGPETRDMILNAGIMQALVPLLNAQTPTSQLRIAVWTYSNLCRNKNPLVQFDLVAPALPYISDLLEISDQDVLADSCWALSYLTDGPNERIEGVQTTRHLLPRLVSLLEHPAPAVATPALRALGNMLTGSDIQTDRCLDADCLKPISRLLSASPALSKEAAWACSNVFAGTAPQIQRAIDSGVLEPIARVLVHHDIKCQKEAAWAITNLCLGGTPEQLDAMLSCDILSPYCALLQARDHRAIIVVLDGLTHLLQAAAKYDQVRGMCIKLEEIGALDQIENLQQHENEQIYKKSIHILDSYFMEEEDASTQPAHDHEQYQFRTNDAAIHF